MNDPKSDSDEDSYPVLARLAIESNIITESQLKDALSGIRIEKLKGRDVLLSDYLIEKKLVDSATMSRLVAATVRFLDKKFGVLAVRHGIVPADIIEKALEIQKRSFKNGELKLVSDILISTGHLTEIQRDYLLAKLDESDPARGENSPEPEPPSKVASDADPDPLMKGPALTLVISDHNLRADIKVSGNLKKKPDIQDVRNLVVSQGLNFGVISDQDILRHLSKTGEEPYNFVVAIGIPASPPRDAAIRLFFKNDYLNPGKITEDGTIDFRDRGEIPFVKTGDLLAEKIPLVDGKPGCDILGETIPAEKAVDVSLKKGTGTNSSTDGLRIYAAIDGQPIMTVHGEIMVLKELQISGDVNYTTGNIIFDGSIIVKGVVNKGFSVKGGALTAQSLLGANVDVVGNINVSGGIIDSVISAGGGVQGMYMTGTKVDSYGDVLIKKEIIDCRIRTSGQCAGDKVSIISSYVAAKKGIDVMCIGTDVSKGSVLKVGVSEHTDKKIQKYKEMLDEKKAFLEKEQKVLEDLKGNQEVVHQKIIDQSSVSDRLNSRKTAIEAKIIQIGDELYLSDHDRHQVYLLKDGLKSLSTEIRKIDDAVSEFFKKQDKMTEEILHYQEMCSKTVSEIEDLNSKIREIKSWDKKSPPLPHVRASKDIYPQTSVSSENASITVKEGVRNVTIREIRIVEDDHAIWDMVIDLN